MYACMMKVSLFFTRVNSLRLRNTCLIRKLSHYDTPNRPSASSSLSCIWYYAHQTLVPRKSCIPSKRQNQTNQIAARCCCYSSAPSNARNQSKKSIITYVLHLTPVCNAFEGPSVYLTFCCFVLSFSRSFHSSTPLLLFFQDPPKSLLHRLWSLSSSTITKQTWDSLPTYSFPRHIHSWDSLNNSWLAHQRHIKLCWDARHHTSVITWELRTWRRYRSASPEMFRSIF